MLLDPKRSLPVGNRVALKRAFDGGKVVRFSMPEKVGSGVSAAVMVSDSDDSTRHRVNQKGIFGRAGSHRCKKGEIHQNKAERLDGQPCRRMDHRGARRPACRSFIIPP